MSGPTLKVENLHTHFFTEKGVVKAVDGVSFEVARGEVLGLVGESGSGKSITGFSILGLVDPPGRVVGRADPVPGPGYRRPVRRRRCGSLRGRRIAMIFQDPMMTLNPVLSIETQMVETSWRMRRSAGSEARAALARCARHGRHSVSGRAPRRLSASIFRRHAATRGDCHRAAAPPDLIIADEPTTALDVTIQSQILLRSRT